MRKLLISALCLLAGCQPQIALHPTEGHIYFVPAGIEVKTVNHGTVTTDKPGLWMSEWYFQKLWEAKVDEKQN